MKETNAEKIGYVGIRFTKDQLDYIRSEAKFKSIPVASLIRMIVAEKLNEENNIKRGQ